jgi:hypothetical protein
MFVCWLTGFVCFCLFYFCFVLVGRFVFIVLTVRLDVSTLSNFLIVLDVS